MRFLAGNRLLILEEAPSTPDDSLLIMSPPCLAENYRNFCKDMHLNLYSSKKLELPIPEIYVVYTGNKKTRPDKISLKERV